MRILHSSHYLICSYIFWLGDLNFRIDDIPNEEVKKRISEGDLEYLWPHDQVQLLRSDEQTIYNLKI